MTLITLKQMLTEARCTALIWLPNLEVCRGSASGLESAGFALSPAGLVVPPSSSTLRPDFSVRSSRTGSAPGGRSQRQGRSHSSGEEVKPGCSRFGPVRVERYCVMYFQRWPGQGVGRPHEEDFEESELEWPSAGSISWQDWVLGAILSVE